MFEPFKVEALSTFASDIDDVIILVTILVGFWFIVAQAALIGFCIRFRRRDGHKAQYISGDKKSEMLWIAIPLMLIVACDVFIARADGPVWSKIKENLPEPDRIVRVIAQQWAWTFIHPGQDGKFDTPDDISTVGEMHVEVNKVYHFELSSRDVLHSFSVPVFRLKQDAIPGRKIVGWFEATGTGTHDIQCTEICGIGHGLMPARIEIETPEQHAAWLAERSQTLLASTTLARAGQE